MHGQCRYRNLFYCQGIWFSLKRKRAAIGGCNPSEGYEERGPRRRLPVRLDSWQYSTTIDLIWMHQKVVGFGPLDLWNQPLNQLKTKLESHVDLMQKLLWIDTNVYRICSINSCFQDFASFKKKSWKGRNIINKECAHKTAYVIAEIQTDTLFGRSGNALKINK